MENGIKKYWRSIDEQLHTPQFVEEASKEFAEELPLEELLDEKSLGLESNRRDFLKIFGFSLTAATLAACNKTPIKKAMPYINAPEDISPSIANYYASTYADGHDYCAILVKTREGRPVKIEGNTLSSITQGGVNARVNASILNLYDNARVKNVLIDGKDSTWEAFDAQTADNLSKAGTAGKQIALVTSSIISPSTKALISSFLSKYPTAKHISYDAVSASGILEANKANFGLGVIPNYRFDNADVIVSVGADFLGNWISPVEFTKQYSKNRKIDPTNPKMNRHYQFESWLSISGSNADYRATYKPSQEGIVVANLYNSVASKLGGSKLAVDSFDLAGKMIEMAATDLVAAKGKSLVVSGSNDLNVQMIINGINHLLSNYGQTIDFANYSNQKQAIQADFTTLVADMASDKVGAVMFYGVNPAYTAPNSVEFTAALSKVATRISFSVAADETSVLCNYHAPDNHYLESWNDAEPKKGHFSLGQPTISNIFDTRQFQDTLLKLNGNTSSYYDFVKSYWKTFLFAKQNEYPIFDAFWRNALYTGVFENMSSFSALTFSGDLSAAASKLLPASAGLELVCYEKVGLGDGSLANNPWLQELPDPISKACWDNYLAVSKKYAQENKLEECDVVSVTSNGYTIEVPVLIQPGQMPQTVALAIGYGRTVAGKVANGVGANAYPFFTKGNGTYQAFNSAVTVTKTGKTNPIALTQTHHTIEGRDIVKETTLDRYVKNKADGNIRPYLTVKNKEGHHVKVAPGTVTLWDEYDYKGHHWMMAIDLNACTGCGSCVVACQSENNVPVVGKKEVLVRREMHWIRIDRYYAFKNNTGAKVDKETEYDTIDKYEDVDVVFQPIMCQQCNHAPCETVCPVLATMHSDEGLNQMAYNRCVGTRYCANNCPYKVRRFNWFNYAHNTKFENSNYMQREDLGRMVLNPDVSVRSRGVMEKCSFCVQRIQLAKFEAKKEGIRPKDGTFMTACQQTCPANAIVFGDKNDPNSEISKLLNNERGYTLLEEINVQPNVNYLTKVRNRNSNNA